MAGLHLHHIALAVPDVPVHKMFYEDFGLIGEERDNQAVMRCAGRDQDQVILVENAERRYHHISFGADEETYAAIKKAAEADDLAELIDSPKETPYEGLWLKDFEGDLYNINLSEAAPSRGGPNPTDSPEPFVVNSPGHYDRLNEKGSLPYDTEVVPLRLGHTVGFSAGLEKKTEFFERVIGLKLTDTTKGLIAFLRVPGGGDHHTIALIQSDRPGFHHASFEVRDLDMVGLGGQAMIEKGYRNGWGLGRHALGSNFFWYIRDPHDGLCEYFADMDYISDDDAWECRDWPMDVGFYLWGPNPAPEFGENYEGSKTTTKPSAPSKGARI